MNGFKLYCMQAYLFQFSCTFFAVVTLVVLGKMEKITCLEKEYEFLLSKMQHLV